MNLNSYGQFQELYTSAFDNSKSLIDDSQLLFSNNRYSRSYLLSHIAIEELARCIMALSGIMTFRMRKLNRKELLLRQKQHFDKIELAYSIVEYFEDYELPLSQGAKEEITKRLIFMPIIPESKINSLNDLKNSSLYADYHRNHVHRPSEIINEKMAEELLKKSNILYLYLEENNWHIDNNLIDYTKNADIEKANNLYNSLFK